MLKNIIRIFSLILIVLTISSCNDISYVELFYYYGEKVYTSDCEFGSIISFWEFKYPENEYTWEDITVISSLGVEESATKLTNFENADIIFMHDFLCINTDTELPHFKNNIDDIESINLVYGENDTVVIRNENQIINFIDFYLKATDNDQQIDDFHYDYVGNVSISFKDYPLCFSAGKILEDKNGDYYFSSSINPNIEYGLFDSFYSIPLNLNA